jgi:hypothetical protein
VSVAAVAVAVSVDNDDDAILSVPLLVHSVSESFRSPTDSLSLSLSLFHK